MRKILGCFIIIMIMITSQIFAATYYVDATNGSDSNSGTSPEIAWKTINKVNNSSFNPGDSILFKKGETWREQLIVPSSGSPGNPITFGAYGSGDNPLIIGSNDYDDPAKWTDLGSNKWATANSSFTSEVKIIWYDTGSTPQLCTKVSNEVDLDTNWEFWYDAGNDRVELYHDVGNPANKTNGLEIGKRLLCIGSGSNRNYITIDGIDMKFANWDGIRWLNTPVGMIIKNLNTNYNGQCGINTVYADNILINNIIAEYNFYGIGLFDSTSGEIKNCSIENNIDHGICLTRSGNIIVQNNMIGHNERTAVGGDQFYNSTVQDNQIYDNEWGGVDMTGITIKCHDNIVRRNIFYDHQGQHYIGAVNMCALAPEGYETYNNKVYYNIFYNNKLAIYLGGRCHDNEVYNNTVYNCAEGIVITYANTNHDVIPTNNTIENNIIFTTSDKLIRDNVGESTNTLNYNCYYPDGTYQYAWNGHYYDTFSAFQSASSQEANAINSAPLFINPSTHDFHLQSSSICINAGTDVGLAQDIDGNTVPNGWAVDIGAYEYQGSVSPPLSAETNASTTSGYVPLAVSFTGSASGGTAPYTYSWDFGDGSSSSDQNLSHTYNSASTYTVTLTVTDSSSSEATDSLIITATSPTSALSASCSASPTSGQVPLSINFTGSASGGTAPYSYSWNFGDGASSTAQNPSHTYTQAGTYTVILTVTDSTASQASASTEVSTSAPVHEVTAPNTPEGPSIGAHGVSYTYTTGGSSCSQGHSVEYYFDWGDGTYSSWSPSTSASHIWSAAGTYSVKVQARCSVNPGVTSLWSEAKTVSLEESPNFQLYISSATDSPASGQGGSTNPDTGTYPYPAGNTAQVTALPATNYRFSKWTGDISGSDSYNSEITFNMDQDKSISALFCTQCGDVNGDLSITPADAQDAFEMFLGIISNATETQKENADVNCDGTATEPNITPADAQAIFEKFLGISELPGDCSCRSRADASSTAFTQNNRSQTASLEIQSGTPTIQLTIDDIDARFKREITVPVRINNPFNIKSFGFDLIFDSGTLEFAGIEIGSLLNGFTMVDANEISEGVVRVGGFSSEPIMTSSPSVLVRLKFRVSGRAKESSPLSITNTFDDIKNAATRPGVVFYKEINDKIMRNKNVF